jgi:dihydrofolate reductase
VQRYGLDELSGLSAASAQRRAHHAVLHVKIRCSVRDEAILFCENDELVEPADEQGLPVLSAHYDVAALRAHAHLVSDELGKRLQCLQEHRRLRLRFDLELQLGHVLDPPVRHVSEFPGWARSETGFSHREIHVSNRGAHPDSLTNEEASLRTLAITQNITVDGSIEMLGDWFDPQGHGDADNSDLLDELHRQASETDGFVLGRRTFEAFRAYWPNHPNDATGISEYLNRVQKHVVSSTMTDPAWQNSAVISGDPVEQLRGLKELAGQDIVVTGSITLCHTLIEASVVDEYRLFVYPVVQGRGRRLFPDGFECPELRVLEAKAFRSGITYTRYARP